MAQFLSDAWFAKVAALREAAGDLEIPEIVRDVVFNVTVSGHPEGDKEIHVQASELKQGHATDAPTKITVPYDVAKALLVDNDASAAMEAFMQQKIQVEGDMTVMMKMQAAGEPSAAAKDLQEKVRAMTEI